MEDEMRSKVVFSLIASVLLLIFGGYAFSQDASVKKVAPPPDPRAGSWWVYETSDGENKIELLRVEKDRFVTKQTRYGDQEILYTPEWNPVNGQNAITGQWQRYEPPIPSFSFPLEEGKRWSAWVTTIQEGQNSFRPRNQPFRVTGRAGKWSKVKVAAGEFEAIEVEQAAVWIKTKCWYAPVVQQVVKCESSDPRFSRELIRYELQD